MTEVEVGLDVLDVLKEVLDELKKLNHHVAVYVESSLPTQDTKDTDKSDVHFN